VFHQSNTTTKLKCLIELERVLKPNGELIIEDLGKVKNKLIRFGFYLLQLLHGFKTTNENIK
jgi:ubiquinone/menaquinone biosynthesis C-methylase UbiE